ncbi:MAG: hypothetical protein ABIJ95_07900, partial [Pseudomonadota bacterium]
MNIDQSAWIEIFGWIATFILGIIATLISQRVLRKKKIIGWTIVNESNLLSAAILNNIQDGFGVPIKISIGESNETTLSTIRIKIGNIGNTAIGNFTVYFKFGDSAKVYVGRYIGDLGVYQSKLSLYKHDNEAIIKVRHINCGQFFEVEFLVGNYQSGGVVVDMAE